jgi:hypothetical protein
MHVQPRLLWGVGVTVLAPAYTTAVGIELDGRRRETDARRWAT